MGHGGGSWLSSLHTDWLRGKALGEAEPGEGQGDPPPEQGISN